ncbi:MAG: hypothetical protein Tsb002_09490 [Wenzhouxiangellaceae bacterium]
MKDKQTMNDYRLLLSALLLATAVAVAEEPTQTPEEKEKLDKHMLILHSEENTEGFVTNEGNACNTFPDCESDNYGDGDDGNDEGNTEPIDP